VSVDGRKRGGGRSGREPASGAAPGTPEFFEEQYRAIEQSLERALAERVATAQGRPAARGVAVAGDEGAGWRRWRPEIYFAISLAGLASLWWRGRGGATAPAAEEPGGSLARVLFVLAAVAGAALIAWVAYRFGRSQAGGEDAADRRPRGGSRSQGPSLSVQALAGVGGAVVVVALLLFGAWKLGWWGGEADPAEDAAPAAREAEAGTAGSEAERAPGAAAVEPDPVPEDPEAAWSGLLESRRVELAAVLSAVSRREGLAAEQISDFQAGAFADRAARLTAGDLAAGDADNIRRGLFEYAYARQEAAAASVGAARRARVSLGFTGFQPAVLGDLLRRLELDDAFSQPYEPLDPALQVAVLDRWLARDGARVGGAGGAAETAGSAP
jgi:hypothetical protein